MILEEAVRVLSIISLLRILLLLWLHPSSVEFLALYFSGLIDLFSPLRVFVWLIVALPCDLVSITTVLLSRIESILFLVVLRSMLV